MKNKLLIIILLLPAPGIFAQEKYNQALKPFMLNESFVSMSGPGEKAKTGDLLLVTENREDETVYMKLLRWQTNGKLKMIAENSRLMISHSLSGNSGGSSASLDGVEISVSVSVGSNSSYGTADINFKKGKDGNYYFSNFTAKNTNYGLEDYFSHVGLISKESGLIKFQDVDENQLWEKVEANSAKYQDQSEEAKKYQKILPKAYTLFEHFALGDLNNDVYKNDLLLGLGNGNIVLLLEQADGTFKKVEQSKNMVYLPLDYNPNNLKMIIKNGYFTIEQRIGNNQNAFNHYYSTFKYDKIKKDWFLHRVGIECYQDYESKPIPPIIQKSNKDFGIIPFKNANIQKIIRYNPKRFQLVESEKPTE